MPAATAAFRSTTPSSCPAIARRPRGTARCGWRRWREASRKRGKVSGATSRPPSSTGRRSARSAPEPWRARRRRFPRVSRYYLTTPIYYVNDRPHIGHAYTTILADAVARERRLVGEDVRFLTGTDEHGDKVERAAAARGLSPQEHVDDLAPVWKAEWDALEIRYDRFIRTTDPDHLAVVAIALEKMRAGKAPDGGPLLYEDAYRGWYCVSDERYWTEKDLVDGRCPECGKPVEEIEERNWFFRMSAFQDRLVDHIQSHPGFIYPESRANEVLGFLREPLADLCISRPVERLAWGVPFPWDDKFVTYVWVDALLNYVTG